ncbi:MAG TPA: sodium/glutamate symporter [Bacteroidales bacterium]|nr:sodium/glutamate symporter [Bacteroidales bacterium]
MEGLSGVFFALCFLFLFLLIGKILRVKVRLFQNIFLPASVIGGFLALALGPYLLNVLPVFYVDTWRQIPGLLINVVFACLFLGVMIPGVKTIWQQGGSQICFGFVVGFGQYFVAILVTTLILIPLFDVPPIFATILEIGFSGGHGTAAGMQQVFVDLGWPAGSALAMMSATVGIITAVVGGVLYINIAIRKGYCVNLDKNKGIPEFKKVGLIPEEQRFSSSKATVASESIEPFAFHFAIVAISILIGWVMLAGVKEIHPMLDGFPLFPLAMVGGMLVQIFSKPLKVSQYFDRSTFERILGFSLDVLVVAAIASLRLDLFLENLWPFVILMAAGIVWVFFCLIYLAPRMFPHNWLERGVTEYGMQTGVTAMGLLLLRLVDSNYRTGTAQAFGFKQMVYEPFMGGGLITAIAPFLLLQLGLWYSMLAALCIMLFFVALSWFNGWIRLKPVKSQSNE